MNKSAFLVFGVISLANFAAAEVSYDQPPPGLKVSAWSMAHLPPPLSERIRRINAASAGEMRLTPTFVSCSVCFGAPSPIEDLGLEYRQSGGTWQKAADLVYFKETRDYRTSLHRLAEDTAYEARLVARGRVVAAGAFRTWASFVPVAKTIEIDPATCSYPIVITNKGSATGWIRYTAKPASIIGGKDVHTSIIKLVGAEYVLVDNLKIVGGGGHPRYPVIVRDTRYVRIRACEFSDFGRVGTPDFSERGGGKLFAGGEAHGKRRRFNNWDTAIMLDPGSFATVVERCYIHDARARANSWYYSHPAGPTGIFVYRVAGSTVLRFNDIVGSDDHRFNDCIEGAENMGPDGGFNRDADIYGNFCIFANDDCIELDGGMQNVRCFDNRFESAVSDVSIQCCCTSPVYVYDNLLGPTGDEFGLANPCIKTASFDPHWYAPYAWISGNWLGEKSMEPKLGPTSRFNLLSNNVFSAGAIPRDVATTKPARDLPFILDMGRIDGVEVKGNQVFPASVTFKAIATAKVPYRVRLNDDCKWFKVEPSSGVMQKGENVFTLTFDPAAMRSRRFWRAAFIIRSFEGLSRCMSVYAERTDFEVSAHPVEPGGKTMYANLKAPVALRRGAEAAHFKFEVNAPGTYWLMARIAPGSHGSPLCEVSVDGEKFNRALLLARPSHAVWIMVNPGKRSRYQSLTRPVELAPGTHTIDIRGAGEGSCRLLDFALTDNPLAFEPR